MPYRFQAVPGGPIGRLAGIITRIRHSTDFTTVRAPADEGLPRLWPRFHEPERDAARGGQRLARQVHCTPRHLRTLLIALSSSFQGICNYMRSTSDNTTRLTTPTLKPRSISRCRLLSLRIPLLQSALYLYATSLVCRTMFSSGPWR